MSIKERDIKTQKQKLSFGYIWTANIKIDKKVYVSQGNTEREAKYNLLELLKERK